MKITYLFIIATVIAILMVMPLFGCSTPSIEAPAPDTPKYSPDQVIYIVQAQYPVSWSRMGGQYRETPSIITVSYSGSGVWDVTVSAPTGFMHKDWTSRAKILHFYEEDGSLR